MVNILHLKNSNIDNQLILIFRHNSGTYRTRDPYNYDQGYRSTSYLYDRGASPNTTPKTTNKDSGSSKSDQDRKMDSSPSNSG